MSISRSTYNSIYSSMSWSRSWGEIVRVRESEEERKKRGGGIDIGGLGDGIGLVHGLGNGHVYISTHIIKIPLEEEQKLNTHLTREATFLYYTYPLSVVRHSFRWIEREGGGTMGK
jgi:hypothetical protein